MFYRFIQRLPWWLRLMLFGALAAPLVNMELIKHWGPDEPLARIMATAVYAAGIWAFIIACIGLEKFAAYMAAAVVMCVATVTIGSSLFELLGLGGITEQEKVLFSEQSINVAFMLTISIPYAFFVVQAFSASRMLERVSKKAGTGNRFQLSIAVCLRVFQHMTEMFPALLIVWKEENPKLLRPRHVDDWRTQHFLRRAVSLVDWTINAAMAWARCLLVFSLRIVPVVDIETKRLSQAKLN